MTINSKKGAINIKYFKIKKEHDRRTIITPKSGITLHVGELFTREEMEHYAISLDYAEQVKASERGIGYYRYNGNQRSCRYIKKDFNMPNTEWEHIK